MPAFAQHDGLDTVVQNRLPQANQFKVTQTSQLADTKAVALVVRATPGVLPSVRMMSRTASWRAIPICKRYPS